MKAKFYLIITSIFLPAIMNAQILFSPGGKAKLHQSSMQSASRKAEPVLFTSSISGYFREDFEEAVFPPAGWQVVDALNPNYTWDMSAELPYNGDHSAFISYDTANVAGEDWLILPKFTVAAVDSFSFWLALQYNGWVPDSTFVLISTTDSLLQSFTSVLATLSEADNYPGFRLVYQRYSYSLSPYAGSDIYVAIMNKNTNGDGIFIDKVEIGTKDASATTVSVDMNKLLQAGLTISPTATVSNDGYLTQSFPVTMTITDGYTSVKNVTNLNPGDSLQIVFDPWTPPAVAGYETVSVQTQLPGDVYAADDSLASSIRILEPFINYGWTSKAPISPFKWGNPLASINTNDTCYLFCLGGNFNGNYTDVAKKYLPYSNSWSAIPDMPVACGYASGASYNNKVYVISGTSSPGVISDENRIYDLNNNSWSLGTPIPASKSYYVLGVYHDSLFYYIGGSDTSFYLSSVNIYNAASDSWSVGTNLPMPVAAAGGGISGNKIVVAGGNSSTYLGQIDSGDPTLITWTTGDAYPVGFCLGLASGATADPESDLIVFTGGARNNELPLISSEYTLAYDLNANQWKIGPPKPTPANNLRNLASVVYNDSVYMVSVGGWTTNTAVNVNEWLNMGPYEIPAGVADNNTSQISFTCYPNPVDIFTDIEFILPRTSEVKAAIVDIVGQEVEVLCNKIFQPGAQQLQWNASKYSNGIYFCSLTVNGITTTQKLVKY
jgi:hypothetical protein